MSSYKQVARRFWAEDAAGNQQEIIEYVNIVEVHMRAGSTSLPGKREYRTPDNTPVNPLGGGKYQLFNSSVELTVVEPETA